MFVSSFIQLIQQQCISASVQTSVSWLLDTSQPVVRSWKCTHLEIEIPLLMVWLQVPTKQYIGVGETRIYLCEQVVKKRDR